MSFVSIRVPSGDKWHYLVAGRTLCGTPGNEIERREIALADAGDTVCRNCDKKLRWMGRAKRPAKNVAAARAARATTYEPRFRDVFE